MALIIAFAFSVDAQEGSTINLVAIDPVIEGNEAAALGPLDGCIAAEVDSEVTVDLIVDAVPDDRPMIGFQMSVTYDPAILEVTDTDSAFLIGSNPPYEPIEGLSDTLPDTDGSLLIVVADLASNVDTGESIETGEGVVSRITFTTLAAGTSEVAVGFDPPNSYPAVIDNLNTIIQVDNLGSASVAVGEDCLADAEPDIRSIPSIASLEPSPSATVDPGTIDADPSGDGIDTGLLIGTIAIAVAGLGAIIGGSVLFLRRRQT